MSLFGGSQQPRGSGGLFGGGGCYPAFGEGPSVPQGCITPDAALPTDVAALQSIINTLQAELKATTSVNTHLAASVARLQAEQSTLTPSTTTPGTPATIPTTTAPLPIPHPNHILNIPSGRGAGSPEVFQQIIKTNWHGRLGRTHMADVDALPPTALMELDSLLLRKLQWIFPHGVNHVEVDADGIFASLAVLGLRLENRAQFVDFKVAGDYTICYDSTLKRARHLSAFYIGNELLENVGYWRGLVLETLVELARYRGLFTDEGFLRLE